MSRIGKAEWILLYIAAGAVDAIQWLIDLTGIGIGFNEVADPFIGAFLGIYFQMRGVSMITRMSRLASLLGATALEEFSVSIAPAWIADVWYIHKSVRQEDAELAAEEQAQAQFKNHRIRPLNEDGVRAPQLEEAA